MSIAQSLGFGMVFTLRDQFSGNAKRIRAEMGGLDASATKMANTATRSMQAGTAFIAAGVAMLAPLALGVKKSMEFNKQVSAVGAVSNASAEQLKTLKEQSMALGETSAFTATQVAKGQEFLAMAGLSVNDVMSAMPGMLDLAAAGQLELGKAADIASNAMAVFGLKGHEAGRAADVLAAAATSSNTTVESIGQSVKFFAGAINTFKIPMEEAVAAIGLMGNAGLQGSIATTALSTAMTRLADPSKKAAKLMKQYGIEAFDAKGKFVGLPGVIAQISKVSKSLTEQQRSQLNSAVFGAQAMKNGLSLVNSEYTDLNGVVHKGSDAIKAYTTQLENSEGAAKRMAEQRLNNLAGSFTKLQSATEGALIRIGDVLEPIIKKVVDGVTSMIGSFNNFMKTPLGSYLVKIVGAVGLALTAFGGILTVVGAVKYAMIFLVPVIKSLTASLMGALTAAAPYLAVLGALVAVGIGLYKSYKAFDDLIRGNTQVMSGMAGVMQKIGAVIYTVIDLFKNANSEGFSFSGKLFDTLKKLGLQEYAKSLGTIVVRIKAFGEGFMSMVAGFTRLFSGLWDSIKQLGDAFAPLFSEIGKLLFGTDKMTANIEYFKIAGQLAFHIVTNGIKLLVTGLRIAVGVVTFLVQGITNTIRTVVTLYNSFSDLFNQLMEGKITIMEFFGGAALAIGNAIWKSFNVLTDSLRQLLENTVGAISDYVGQIPIVGKYLGLDGSPQIDTPTETNSQAGPSVGDPLNQSGVVGEFSRDVVETAKARNRPDEGAVPNSTGGQATEVVRNITLNLDGEVLAEVIDRESAFKDSITNES